MNSFTLNGIRNIRNHIKKTLLGVLVLSISFSSHSKIHEFETTQLKSSGGTGVGGIFNEESAFLNPAPLAFSTSSSFYVQKDSDKLSDNSVNKPNPKALGFVMSDGNPSLSGSLSFVNQHEDTITRKRWGVTLSGPIAEKSSMGISVRHSEDNNTLINTTEKYYQSVFGVSHQIDNKLSLGIVAYDPFKSKGNETKALVGLQYNIMEYIATSLDFGGDYTSNDISKKLITKGAVQVKVLDDFFLRFGGFSDKSRSEKGSGFGLAWLQPRLAFEFAIKTTKRDADTSIAQTATNFKETSFAASIRF